MDTTKNKKKTICVDFDGVCNSYTSGWTDIADLPDPPVDGAFAALVSYMDAGYNVSIYSARSKTKAGRDAMLAWFKKHGFTRSDDLKFPSNKPPAILYIDDRGYQFDGKFPSVDYLNEFKPWYKRVAPAENDVDDFVDSLRESYAVSVKQYAEDPQTMDLTARVILRQISNKSNFPTDPIHRTAFISLLIVPILTECVKRGIAVDDLLYQYVRYSLSDYNLNDCAIDIMQFALTMGSNSPDSVVCLMAARAIKSIIADIVHHKADLAKMDSASLAEAMADGWTKTLSE